MSLRLLAYGCSAMPFLLAVATTGVDAAGRDFECPHPLVYVNADGTSRSGSKEKLIAAVNAGERVRVGWRLGPPENGLTHWADPIFLTVFHDNVHAQIPAIHVQQGTRATKSVDLVGEQAQLWYGLIGTDGRLSGRIGNSGKIDTIRVEQAWCSVR